MKAYPVLLRALRMPLCVLLLAALLFSAFPAARAETLSGECGREGSDLRWTLDENGVLTISGVGEMADFPENSTRPWPVSAVVALVLSEGVSSVGDFAFFGCRRLESVTFPDTLRSVGKRAFFYCSRLRSVELPDSVTSLGSNPFAHCSALERVTTGPENPALAVCDGALLSLEDARVVWYPDSPDRTELKVPDGIRTIDEYAFAFCRSLRTVTLPDSLVSVGARAFDGCSSLRDLVLPAGLAQIGNQAFADCTGLRTLAIPGGVTELGPYTFARCSGLGTVSVPDGVTAISGTAFYRCYSLTVTAGKGSAAERFCLEHGLPFAVA